MTTEVRSEDQVLREQLHELIWSGSAHADIDTALASFPFELAGKKPSNSPHTAWQVLEHMRIAVHDILEFSTNPDYLAPKWPDDYWPEREAPKNREEWEAAVQAFKADCRAMSDLAGNPRSNLYAQIPWGQGQTLLREILLAADHTSYHMGQLILLRKQLGNWPHD